MRSWREVGDALDAELERGRRWMRSWREVGDALDAELARGFGVWKRDLVRFGSGICVSREFVLVGNLC